MNVQDIQSKYGATYTPVAKQAPNPYQPLTDKYGATYSAPQAQTTLSKVGDFIGLPNLSTYIPGSFNQAKNAVLHPIQTIQNVGKAAYSAIDSAFAPFSELSKANYDTTMKQEAMATPAQKVAGIAGGVSTMANILFSPVNTAFAAAQQVPVLKQAADVLQVPFAATGKLGDFAAEKFIDYLPIDQASKDALKPAFGQLGALAGQVLLGGKVMDLVGKGYEKFTSAKVEELVSETKNHIEQSRGAVIPQEPMNAVADRYKATYTPPETKTTLRSSNDLISHEGAPDLAQVEKYKADIQAGKKIEPLKIIQEGDKFGIEDGKHRFEAYKQLGHDQIPVEDVTNKTKNSSPLAQEATKYKSAEEFVNRGRDNYGEPVYVYHTTPVRNLESIKTQGLLPEGDRSIHFAQDAKSGVNWGNKGEPLFRALKVDVQGLEEAKTAYNTVSTKTPVSPQFLEVSMDRGKTWKPLTENSLTNRSQLTDIWNRANKNTSSGLEPFKGTGETKTRGLSLGVFEKAVENKLSEGLHDLPEYKTVNMAEQAKSAVDLVNKDYEMAKRIAMGEETAPKNVIPEAVYNAVEMKATSEGDAQTISNLAKSSLTTEATTMGQRIRTLAERNPESAVGAIKDLEKTRGESVKRKVKDVAKVTKDEIANIKEEIKKATPKKGDWSAFIDSLGC